MAITEPGQCIQIIPTTCEVSTTPTHPKASNTFNVSLLHIKFMLLPAPNFCFPSTQDFCTLSSFSFATSFFRLVFSFWNSFRETLLVDWWTRRINTCFNMHSRTAAHVLWSVWCFTCGDLMSLPNFEREDDAPAEDFVRVFLTLVPLNTAWNVPWTKTK